MSTEEPDMQSTDIDSLLSDDDDKTYAAMGVAKTIGTVRLFLFCFFLFFGVTKLLYIGGFCCGIVTGDSGAGARSDHTYCDFHTRK